MWEVDLKIWTDVPEGEVQLEAKNVACNRKQAVRCVMTKVIQRTTDRRLS
jgi:hypothetical protein